MNVIIPKDRSSIVFKKIDLGVLFRKVKKNMKKPLNTNTIMEFFKNNLIVAKLKVLFALFCTLAAVGLLCILKSVDPAEDVEGIATVFKWFLFIILFAMFTLGIVMVYDTYGKVIKIKNKIKTVKSGEYKLEKDYLKKKYIKNGRMCGELESRNIIYFRNEDEYNQAKASVDGKSASIMYRVVCKDFSGPTFPAFKYELSDECKEKVCDFSFNTP